MIRTEAGWSTIWGGGGGRRGGGAENSFLISTSPVSLKRKVFEQCVLPTLTYIMIVLKLKTNQRAMDRKILHIKFKYRIRHAIRRQRTKVTGRAERVRHTEKEKPDQKPKPTTNKQTKPMEVGWVHRRWTSRSTDWQTKHEEKEKYR